MKIIAVVNKKGGVGKTSIAVNLAYAFAEACDLKVLLADNDDQGNLTQFFALEPEMSLADVLLGRVPMREAIQHTRYPNIDILASGEDLLDANVAVIKDETMVQQSILQKAMATVAGDYDICIIDNPPTINASVINALVASNEVIIVTTPDMYGIRGVAQMAEYIDTFRAYNPGLRFRGCLLNKFAATQHGLRCIQQLTGRFPLFRTKLRYTKDKLEASAEAHQSIFEYSPRCGFARDLNAFVDEFLEGE